MQRTPLFEAHRSLGAKLIEFGGWEMPVYYRGIVEEHLAVRTAAGLFDICHMGELSVSGPAGEAFLNQVLTNDARKLAVGQGQYSLMCNERGGVVDDLYLYRLAPCDYLLMVNAARTGIDFGWLERSLASFAGRGEVRLGQSSNATGALALQGPSARLFVDACCSSPARAGTKVSCPSELSKNQVAEFGFEDATIWVARTGYTGEDGFEFIGPANLMVPLWERVLSAGAPYGLKPAGLGARDTLRTEVCYPLYGHELDENTTPVEAGLSAFVAWDKSEFSGRSVLAAQRANGLTKRLVAFRMTERSAPPRPDYPIWSPGVSGLRLGKVVSGTQSPSLGVGIGLGYVPPDFAGAQTAIEIEIRGKRAPALVTPKPLFRKPN